MLGNLTEEEGVRARKEQILRRKCSFEAKILVIKFGFDYISITENFHPALKKRVLILDFSGALRAEGILPENGQDSGCLESGGSVPVCELEKGSISLAETPENLPKVSLQITTPNEIFKDGAEVLDFTGLEGARCYCDPEAEAKILKRLAPFRYGGEKWREHPIHFIDTGEYHYLSKFFIDPIDVPFTLLVLDNHTDMQDPAFGGDILSCGSWLAEVMRTSKCLQNVILAGPEGNIVLFERASQGGALTQSSIERLSVEGMRSICSRISVRDFYISIDKDVMSKNYYQTSWTQGDLSPQEITDILFLAFDAGSVLGVDICGGLDASKSALTCDLAINRRTDIALLDALVLIGAFA